MGGKGALGEARNAAQDLVRGLHPDEGLCVGVGGFGVGLDGVPQLALGAVTASSKLAVGQPSAPALHLVEPGAMRRREVEVDPRMPK